MSMVIHAYESEHFLTESITDIEIPSSHLEEIDYFFKILNLDRNLDKSKTLFSNEIVDLGLDLYDGFLSRKRITELVNNFNVVSDFDYRIKNYLETILRKTKSEYILFSYT
ncbi:hypothetical protein [Vagococcus fluvialis]|uniref:hypothetical protein n=1 Tax=Vagococcus fluvialis TaxID=2738 RepID=UPI003B5BE1D1